MKRLLLASAAATALLSSGAFAQTPPQNRENCGAELNYDKADISAVVDEIAMRTGRTFLLDPRVTGEVTVKSPPNGGICPDEAWELFQAMLRVNGFAATPIGANKYKIVPVQEGPRMAGPVGEGAGGDLVTQIVRLRYVDAREAAANISQIINERGVAAPVRSGNSIILVDTADNVERLKQVLEQLDRDTTVYRTIPLNNASATEVARVVSGLAREISEEGGGAPTQVSVVPVEASNSVLIRAEPAMITRLSSVVAELDRIGAAKADLSVVFLNNADAEDLVPLLREVANSQSASPGADGQPVITNQRAAISFHKPTNSIIINGDADIQQTLHNVISQLDVRRAQVLIEAIIVEISDDTARNLGLEYFITGTAGSPIPFMTTNFRESGNNILALAGPALIRTGHVRGTVSDAEAAKLTQTALNALLGINGLGIGGIGEIGDNPFGVLLTAIKEDDTSNVLSTPSIVTLDNQEASLSVGQEIPITTGEAVSDNLDNAFRTVSREQVGVILEVTPQINEGGTVTLEITQETSSIAGPIIDTSTDLITNKREIRTTALVDDGDILVIGGLIDDQQFSREDKVPFLGDLPVAGNLFKTSSRSKTRRNLMVFIRPTILRDKETAQAATRKKMDYLKAKELLYTGEARSGLEKLIDQVTGVAPVEPAVNPDENE